MNIAIVGKSGVNGELRRHLAEEGFIPFLFENPADINKFEGEEGGFFLHTGKNRIEAGYVIVTEDSEIETPFDSIGDAREFVAGTGSGGKTVVLVMDYPHESPSFVTEMLLSKAFALAKRQQKVICLSRSMRVASPEIEKLYRNVRNLGVVFIRYNEISIIYEEEDDIYTVRANDGYEVFEVTTRYIGTYGQAVPGAGVREIAGILRLKPDENGFVDWERHFTYPVLTNRKGIYFLSALPGPANKAMRDALQAKFRFITHDIKTKFAPVSPTPCGEELKLPAAKTERRGLSLVFAEIDADKCAFCYTCFRACPHAAMAPDPDNPVMRCWQHSCDGCGICASVCPAGAIVMREEAWAEAEKGSGQELDKARNSVLGKAPEGASENVPEGAAENTLKNTLEILCCENSGEIAARRLADGLDRKFDRIRITPETCGGGISVNRILTALKENGRVLVLTCMDDACRHYEGNKRAHRQVERVRELLRASGLDENRVECMSISHAMPNVLLDILNRNDCCGSGR